MESEMRALVNDHIEAFAECKGIAVLFPNVDPPDDYRDNPKTQPDEKYTHLIVRFFPVPTRVLHPCSGTGIRTWLLQVTVKIRDGLGELVATRLVDALADHLPVSHIFAGVDHSYRVVKPADPKPELVSGGWYAIPVRFRINTFT